MGDGTCAGSQVEPAAADKGTAQAKHQGVRVDLPGDAQPLARPWRCVPLVKPAFSSLAISHGPNRLAIATPRLTISAAFANSYILTTCTLLFASVLNVPTVDDEVFKQSMIALAVLLCAAAAVLARIVAVRSYVGLSFTLDSEAWSTERQDSCWCGLATQRHVMTGSIADLLGARVAAAGFVSGQIATRIEFLEAAAAADTRAVQAVYTPTPSSGAAALALAEQEFIAALVNHHLERTRRSTIDAIENDLASTAAGFAAPVSSVSPEHGLEPDAGELTFKDSAPFARPATLVSQQPLAGCRFETRTMPGGGTAVTIGRELRHYPRYNFAVLAIYLVLLCVPWLDSDDWLLPVILLLSAGAACFSWSAQRARALKVDELKLGQREWQLTQHMQLGRTRRGKAWQHLDIEDRGPLSDLVGAQVTSGFVLRPRGIWTKCGAVHGTLALVHADGALEHLTFLNITPSTQELEWLAALITAHVRDSLSSPSMPAADGVAAGTDAVDSAAASGATAVHSHVNTENDVSVSALTDILHKPNFINGAAESPDAAAAPAAGEQQAALLEQLSTWDGRGAALLRAVPRLVSRRVTVTVDAAAQTLSLVIEPAAAEAGTATVTCAIAFFAVFMILEVALVLYGSAIVHPSSFELLTIVALIVAMCVVFAALLLTMCKLKAPLDVRLDVDASSWTIQRQLFGFKALTRIMTCRASTLAGQPITGCGCKVKSRVGRSGSVTTSLVWCVPGAEHVLSAADYRGVSLHEKVFAMQQVNLFLARVADSGEADAGDDIHGPLLPHASPLGV